MKLQLFLLLVLLCPLCQDAISQETTSLYPAQEEWLEENHFPVHIYEWNNPTINKNLSEALKTKSLAKLKKTTINWLDLTLGDKYEGTDLFRSDENARWLKDRNIHIEYYDGSMTKFNDMLNKILRNRRKHRASESLGIALSSIGGGLLLASQVQGILGSVKCGTAGCASDFQKGVNQRSAIGGVFLLSGFTVILAGGRKSGGNIKSNLRNFSKQWYQQYDGYY
ncbi:MAG: hypothetical protein R8G66_25270 [Cytophagales bacterium]|nr:hypothetical protein [Cytophagales bacterium]